MEKENTSNDFPESSENSSFSPEETSLKAKEPKEIIPPEKNEDEILKEANKIARWSFRINTGLFVCTLGALIFTWWSVDIANESLSDTRERNKQSDSLNAVQYEQMNRPILQAGDITVEDFEVGKTPKVSYVILNLGKFPAKIIDVKSVAYLGPTDMKDSNFSFSVKKTVKITNSAVGGGTFVPATEPLQKILTRSDFELYTSEKLAIYFFYVNRYKPFSAYDKIYTNTCLYRITHAGRRVHVTSLQNEDK